MGFSPPGPAPRDGLAIVSDFEQLVAASGEQGPFILVGHSMAGLRLREYAGRNPGKVAGLVLVDAATADASETEAFKPFIEAFSTASRWAARGASIGLFKPLVYTGMGDKIGLPPAAKAEKRWAFASGRHNRTAAAEVALWSQSAQQAVAVPAYDPDWPVAVVTAGPVKGREKRKAMQAAPAERSRRGYVDHVEAASHTRLLGETFAGHIVKAVEFVAGKGARPPQSASPTAPPRGSIWRRADQDPPPLGEVARRPGGGRVADKTKPARIAPGGFVVSRNLESAA
jgi:pimeloyl-ACP methyl ester carboxylesterase